MARTSSGNGISRFFNRLDTFQQHHKPFDFVYAVIKKYGEDRAGQWAALLTYYGFLSLFPLLLVATSITDILAEHNAHLRARLLADITSYFPIVGNQLQADIHSSHRTGIALVIGLLFTIYGTRGIADAIRNTLDGAWGIARRKRSDFRQGTMKSFGLLLGAGVGLLVTTVLASYATAVLGRSLVFRSIPIAINAVLLYQICMFVFLVGASQRRVRRDLRLGAVATVVGVLILQVIGGYLITHQLHNLSGFYGQFALVLAILFWIYLQAQVFTYAIEINVVHTFKLWPRSFDSKPVTLGDTEVR